MLEMSFPAKCEHVREITEAVNEFLDMNECPMLDRIRLDVAIDELFSNICFYAYTPGEGTVTIQVEALEAPRGIVIRFIDLGIPYDPTAYAMPDLNVSVDERRIGGLGIFMVKKTMSRMEYERKDEKNILSITKYFGETK